MRLHQPFCARIATIVVAVVMISSVSAFGQQVSGSGQPGPARLSLAVQTAAQNAAQQPGEAVRRISIDEAVKLAMEQNLGIRIQRFDPQIQDTGVSLSRSLWQPNFSTTVTRQAQTQASTSALAGGSTVNNGQFSSNVGQTPFLVRELARRAAVARHHPG